MNIEELKSTINSALGPVSTAFREFKEANDKELAELIRRFDAMDAHQARMESKANRPGGGGFRDEAEAKQHVKNLNAYIRGDFKAMTTDYDPSAGYLVPRGLSGSLIEKLYDPPTLLSLVRTERWDGAGGSWIEPRKRAMVTARRRGTEIQASQSTETTDPLGLLEVPAGEAETELALSQKLLDDAAYDVASMVLDDSDQAFDSLLDAEIVSGTGTGNQASGFLQKTINTTGDATRAWGEIQYVPSGDALLVTADALKSTVYTLRAPYRASASWVMSSTTAAAVDKLKASGSGDYLWRDSLAAGQPPTLLGFPVYFDENMPAIAAGSYPIAFSNWRLSYVAAKKKETRFLRDPYSKKPMLVIYGYKRQGGDVANSEAIKLLKIGTS